jgi:anti-sigma B factor antagonist
MRFSHHIEELNDALVCTLKGRLFQEDDSKALYDQIYLEMQTGQKNVIFHLAELTHCNSSGINVFVRTMTKTRVNGGETYLSAPNEQLSQLFEIAKINEIFSIQDSVEDAIQLIKKGTNK